MTYCEDYPACGHTPADPCAPQWYDAPDAFDTSVNPHALCDHENGECDVWYDEDDYDEDDEDCPDCGQPIDSTHCADFGGLVSGDWSGSYPNEDAAMEFGLFGSET